MSSSSFRWQRQKRRKPLNVKCVTDRKHRLANKPRAPSFATNAAKPAHTAVYWMMTRVRNAVDVLDSSVYLVASIYSLYKTNAATTVLRIHWTKLCATPKKHHHKLPTNNKN
jgi:hypothetical protein